MQPSANVIQMASAVFRERSATKLSYCRATGGLTFNKSLPFKALHQNLEKKEAWCCQ